MKITDLLTKDTILLNMSAASKPEAIDELVGKLDTAGKLNDRAAFKQAIEAREEQSTTGIGDGIAIPHAKTAAVKIQRSLLDVPQKDWITSHWTDSRQTCSS